MTVDDIKMMKNNNSYKEMIARFGESFLEDGCNLNFLRQWNILKFDNAAKSIIKKDIIEYAQKQSPILNIDDVSVLIDL